MRFLKNQTISKYGLRENSFKIFERPAGHTGEGSRAVMDLTGALRLPKGTTDQRPAETGVEIPEGANGYIRYNTSIDSVTGQQIGLEVYINGSWEIIRAPGSATITKREFGPGDYVDDVFGPLPIVPSTADNILVFVENVFQISTRNFLLEQNTVIGTGQEILATALTLSQNGTEYIILDAGTTDFTLIGATSINATSLTAANNGTEYIITSIGSTDFTLIGAASNTVGLAFTKSGATGSGTGTAIPRVFTKSGGTGLGTGEVRETGWYLRFQEPVPLDKYVTVYFGFAN